jgi:D-arabinose 1-dehydrogenase-like Zn-dependent alcohol dehydrogenase
MKMGMFIVKQVQQTIGITRDGAFAECLLADSLLGFHLPASLPFVPAAPLMCAGVKYDRHA